MFFPCAAETAAANAAWWAAAAWWTAFHCDNKFCPDWEFWYIWGSDVSDGKGGEGAIWDMFDGEDPSRGETFEFVEDAAARAAARAAPGKNPGGAWPGKKPGGGPCGAGPRMPLNIIMALAFSAAAAAAIMLLFSASDKRGDRNKNEVSMYWDENPYESLKN